MTYAIKTSIFSSIGLVHLSHIRKAQNKLLFYLQLSLNQFQTLPIIMRPDLTSN